MPRVAVQNLPYSLRFDGNAKVVLPTLSASPSGGTVAFRFKSTTIVGYRRIFDCKGETVGHYGGWSLQTHASSSGKLAFYTYDSSGSYVAAASTSVIPTAYNAWNSCVVVWTADVANIFINGALAGTATITGWSPSDNQYPTIGQPSAYSSSNFVGNVSDFVYNNGTQWSAADVTRYHSTGAVPSSVTAHYRLTEGSGPTTYDISGNNNHGTITNGTWSTDTPSKLRTVSTNRVTAQNMNCALSMRTATSIVDCGADPIGTGDVTVMGWFKAFTFGGTNQGRLLGNQKFLVRITSLNSLYAYNDGATSVSSGNNSISLGKWYHVGITRKASGAITFYIHGALVGTPDQISVAPVAATANLLLGNSSALIHNFDGLMKNWVTVNRICSQAEVQAHRNGITPSDATRIYKMNEGTGSTIYDSSGSGVNGSITNGTFVSDTPTKKRQIVGGNLLYNGDFSHIPEVNEPQTANNKFMDGTATGSSTNNLFGWSIGSSAGSFSALFDRSNRTPLSNPSLKLSLLDVGSTVSALLPGANGLLTGFFGKSVLSVSPSTSYTLSFYIKTNYISGDSDEGAFISLAGSNGSGTSSGFFANSAKYTRTIDWVKQTLVFTTNSTTRYLQVYPRNSGAVGSATLIMDAWFGNITLTKTTLDARGIAS